MTGEPTNEGGTPVEGAPGGAAKWRRIFYLSGWAFVVLAFALGFLSFVNHPRSDRLARFTGEFLAIHVGLALLLVAIGLSLLLLVRHRRPGFLVGPLLSSPIIVLAVWSGALFKPNFRDPVCGPSVGCFALSVAPVPTDVVFEIWKAPSERSLMWSRLETGGRMNYSEDGSYLADPRLVLSENDRILVLARGGYLVDAIETQTGRVLSQLVLWNDDDRDARMAANSTRISQLLDQNQ